MSISNRHTVNPFVAGKSAPMSEQRLARVGYKSTAKNPAKYQSVCASVPQILSADISEEQIKNLMPHIVGLLESAQDGIFKSLYESADGKLECLRDEDISVDACIAYLSAEAEGSRLTKELLESWFTRAMADNLNVVIAEKLGFDLSTPEQEETVSRHVNAYKGLISALAGGKTLLVDHQIKGLRKALECVPEDDMSVRIGKRLDAMENKPKMADLLEL